MKDICILFLSQENDLDQSCHETKSKTIFLNLIVTLMRTQARILY